MSKFEIPELPFYFIRHGETDWNLKRQVMGSTDIELNATGMDQAYSAAYILTNIELSKICTSDLKRAHKTAEIISSVCELDVEIIDSLRERSWGAAEGKNNDNTLSFLTNENLQPNAEDYKDFEGRIIASLQKILSPTDKYPLIVSHGGVFKVLSYLLTGEKRTSCPNCKIFFFTPPSLGRPWEIAEI